MGDQFDWWRAALKGNVGAVHDGVPQSGYFKLRDQRDGPWMPVAIWIAGDTLRCRVGESARDPHETWIRCAKHPVAKEAAKQAFEAGTWPGDVPQMGDNSGTLSLAEEIADAVEQATAWLRSSKITDKTAADTAANWRARLLDLGKQADRQRTEEKRPHDEAASAVQAKWKPVVDAAERTAAALRGALTLWLRARAEADAKRRASEPTDVPLPLPEPARVQAGGQRGRKTGLRTITRYVVTDYAAALAHVQGHPDVVAAVEKVAAAMAKAGAAVPGVEAKQEQVAA